MEFGTLVQKAKEVKIAYGELNKKKGEKNWGVALNMLKDLWEISVI